MMCDRRILRFGISQLHGTAQHCIGICRGNRNRYANIKWCTVIQFNVCLPYWFNPYVETTTFSNSKPKWHWHLGNRLRQREIGENGKCSIIMFDSYNQKLLSKLGNPLLDVLAEYVKFAWICTNAMNIVNSAHKSYRCENSQCDAFHCSITLFATNYTFAVGNDFSMWLPVCYGVCVLNRFPMAITIVASATAAGEEKTDNKHLRRLSPCQFEILSNWLFIWNS